MDFYVVMGRPGARVAKRKHAKGRVGATHRVRKEDSQAWCVQPLPLLSLISRRFKSRFDGLLSNK